MQEISARELAIGDVIRIGGRERSIRSSRFLNTPDNFVLISGDGLKTAHALEFTFEDGETARLHPGQMVRAVKHQIPQ